MNLQSNNVNPLRAPYPELGGREAMEALKNAGIYVGPGECPEWANVQLDPTGGDVVSTAAGIACTPPASMPAVTDMQKAVDMLGEIGYEAGTWTPILRDAVGPITCTYKSLVATYTKIGRLCWVVVSINSLNVTGVHDGTQSVRPTVDGLPYAAKTYFSLPVSTSGISAVITNPVSPVVANRSIILGAAYTGWKVGYVDPAINVFLLVCAYEIA